MEIVEEDSGNSWRLKVIGCFYRYVGGRGLRTRSSLSCGSGGQRLVYSKGQSRKVLVGQVAFAFLGSGDVAQMKKRDITHSSRPFPEGGQFAAFV